MMTEIEAIKERHSVRNYKNKKIKPDKVKQLMEKMEELNEKGGLHFVFIEEADSTFNKLPNRMLGLNSAPSLIACMGKESEDLDERVGYYGEQLVLFAQQIGLNTCWAGIFNRNTIPVQIPDGERLVISIAVGYGENAGKERRSKRADQVSVSDSNTPYWFHYGVEMALLAPTAMNQQKFEISYRNREVSFRDKGGPFSSVDLGIVMYHFKVGAKAAREMERKK